MEGILQGLGETQIQERHLPHGLNRLDVARLLEFVEGVDAAAGAERQCLRLPGGIPLHLLSLSWVKGDIGLRRKQGSSAEYPGRNGS